MGWFVAVTEGDVLSIFAVVLAVAVPSVAALWILFGVAHDVVVTRMEVRRWRKQGIVWIPRKWL